MDKIYNPNKYKNSGFLQPIEFLCQSSENSLLPKIPYPSTLRKEEIVSLMDMDIEEDFEALAQKCSADMLQGDEYITSASWSYQKTKFIPTPITPEALKLNTVAKYSKWCKSNYRYKQKNAILLKYRSERRVDHKECSTESSKDLVPGENLVMTIRLYHPFKHKPGTRYKEPVFYHNLVVLGSQTLDVLRDKIICSTEHSTSEDISENPEQTSDLVKNVFQSGFLFINNVFYNDTRNSKNIDYSECIIEWAKTKRDIGEFKTASMSDVTFNELNIQLGYPHIYKHLGDCEHLFTFSDIEVLQPSDPCTSLAYPMYTSCSHKKGQYCHMCGTFIAKWRVTESDRIPFDPAFFCETCFHSYNYIDGVKVGSFKAYSYLDSINAL